MAVVTRQELEDAQRDVEDLEKIINGASDLPNPGQPAPNNFGTVTTRLGAVVKTLSKLVADGYDTVAERLEPIRYSTTVERENALGALIPGQTAYDAEDTNLYIVSDDPDNPGTNIWEKLSDLQKAASADLSDLLKGVTTVGRVSVADYYFLKERDKLFEKDALRNHHVQWPGKDTPNSGLAKVIGYTAWNTTGHLEEAVDFGCRIPVLSLKDVSDSQYWIENGGIIDWIDTTRRAALRNDNANVLEGYYFPSAYCDINSNFAKTSYLRDCYIDTNYTKLQCISKGNVDTYPAYVEYCTLRKFTSEAVNLNAGHLAFCDIELSRGDGLKGDGTGGLVIHANLVRLLGQDIPSAHADALQVQNASGLDITQNTFYMPGTGTAWDEDTYGSTQCLRLITENAIHVIEDVYAGGNLFIGGGFTIAVRSRVAGSLVQNVVIANNVIAGTEGGNPFFVYGPITNEHWIENNPGTIRNLIFWDNLMHDGSVFATEGSPGPQDGTDQNGIWHFDKTYATPRFLEMGKRLGLLDWNGDLASGVTNRTTG